MIYIWFISLDVLDWIHCNHSNSGMLFCGCYHNYVIEPDQFLVPFGVTRKNYSKWFCMPYT